MNSIEKVIRTYVLFTGIQRINISKISVLLMLVFFLIVAWEKQYKEGKRYFAYGFNPLWWRWQNNRQLNHGGHRRPFTLWWTKSREREYREEPGWAQPQGYSFGDLLPLGRYQLLFLPPPNTIIILWIHPIMINPLIKNLWSKINGMLFQTHPEIMLYINQIVNKD